MTQLFMVHPGPLPVLDPAVARSGVVLREAVDGDAVGLAALLADAFESAEWDESRARTVLLDHPEVLRTWLAIDKATGEVLGTASEAHHPDRYGERGYVHFVGAGSAARGRGVGALLMQAVMDGFVRDGRTGAVLETDDFRLPAVRLYLRLGFVPEYRSEEERAAWSRVLPELVR